MKRVVVASANPVKIACAQVAFEQIFLDEKFEVTGLETPSGVSKQPISEEETLAGANNRIDFIKSYYPEADFWVSIEGGVRKIKNYYEAFAWVLVHNGKKTGRAQTASFELPQQINNLIDRGVELGHADDAIFNRKNSKQKDGSVGQLTRNIIDRKEYYRHALVLALIPFLNPGFYQ